MIVFLGVAMIAVFMFLILTKRTTPVVALILVPGVFAIIAQASGVATVPDGAAHGAVLRGRPRERPVPCGHRERTARVPG